MTGKLKKFLLVNSVALSALSFNAFAAEPGINQILNSIETGSWAEITNLNDFYNSTWNVAGTSLDFKLNAEFSSFAPSQTFSVQNHLGFKGSSDTIFGLTPDDSKVGDTFNYVLGTSLTSGSFNFKTNIPAFYAIFNSNYVESNTYKIWFNAASSTYALSYEDSPNFKDFLGNPIPNDYNDMVVSFKYTTAVTPVPEANTAAMLGLGFGLMVWLNRRRRVA